jgi:hypothetical protein
MKQEKKLANNNNTRLPIPIQNKSSAVLCKGKSKSSNDNSENECEIHNKQKEDSMTHTKLRRPGIFTSKSVKRLSSRFNQEMTLDQIAKERLIKPSASYVSAHGVISQPDEEAILKHSSEPNRKNKSYNQSHFFVEGGKTQNRKEKGITEVVSSKSECKKKKKKKKKVLKAILGIYSSSSPIQTISFTL